MHSWNSRRLLVVAALGVGLLVAGGSALAASGKAPSHVKIAIKGGETFKPNVFDKDSSHYTPGTVTVRSGATVTLTNDGPEPHSLSLVAKSALPRTVGQLNNCGICRQIAITHGINPMGPPTSGPPPHPVVDVGAPGFNEPGDSIVIGPKGPFGKVAFKVTAKKGTTLYFMCIVHPWMQGRFLVK